MTRGLDNHDNRGIWKDKKRDETLQKKNRKDREKRDENESKITSWF